MTASPPEQPNEGRLPYEKPTLRSISLVVDQVLGVGCKSARGTFAVGVSYGCLANFCVIRGS